MMAPTRIPVPSSKEDSTERHSDGEFPVEFDRERKSIEDEEHDNTTSRSTSSPRTKANCFPAAWLLLFLIVLNIKVPPSAGVPCSDPTDIRLKNTKTGGIDCILCPECGQSQQYSIPCGSTVDIAPDLRCVDCPKGTFSEHFDKKPCKPCTICTNKVYKRNCTKDHNAICGSCLPGYRHDPITFACNLIIKKVKTSSMTKANPTTSTTTAATTAKRTTVTTKQATTKGVTETPPIPAVIFTYNAPQPTITDPLPTVKSQLPPIIEIKTYQPSSTLRNDSKKSGSPTNQPWIIAFAISSVICVVLSLLGVVAYIRRMKRAKSSRRIDAEMQPLNGKSTLLSQYMNDSKSLSHAKHGTICNKVNAKSRQNFKALVCGLGIQPDTVYQFYSQGKGDFHLVLDTLISSKPELTLEGIAQECERQTFKDVANLFREEDKRFQKEKKDSNN